MLLGIVNFCKTSLIKEKPFKPCKRYFKGSLFVRFRVSSPLFFYFRRVTFFIGSNGKRQTTFDVIRYAFFFKLDCQIKEIDKKNEASIVNI